MISCLKAGKHVYHRLGVRHVVLITVYLAYLVVGATLFYTLEHENEQLRRLQYTMELKKNRTAFIRDEIISTLFNNSEYLVFLSAEKTQNFQLKLEEQFAYYERKLNHRFPHGGILEWDFANAIFYAATLATTVGYGMYVCLFEE